MNKEIRTLLYATSMNLKMKYGQCGCGYIGLITARKSLCKICYLSATMPAKKQRNIKLIKKLNKGRKELVKELDEIFSKFVRLRNAKDGIVACFTCGKRNQWKKMQCGHYHSRRFYSTRWDEINCQVQCVDCNILHEGNKPVFAIELKKKYGEQILDFLNLKRNNRWKIDTGELKLLITYYSEKVKQLKF